MTYKEKLQQEHPEYADPKWDGGCMGCPDTHGYEYYSDCGELDGDCDKCWSREIPEEVSGDENPRG